MGRYGAECTSSKTSAMNVYREFNHIVGRNALALIFWVRLTCVRQIERCVELLGSHRRVGRIHHYVTPVNSLYQSLCVHHVRLLFNVLEVLSLCTFVSQTLLMTVQHNVLICYATRNLFLACQINRLRHIANFLYIPSLAQSARHLYGGLFAHTIGNHVGPRVAKYALLQFIMPVVVMSNTAQRCLDAAKQYGHVRIKFLQNLGVYYSWVFRTHVVPSVRTICIFRTQTSVCCILVNHRVHASWCYAEEQAWFA